MGLTTRCWVSASGCERHGFKTRCSPSFLPEYGKKKNGGWAKKTMHCLSNSKLVAMRGGSGAPARTHSRLLEKKVVLLAASRSGSGYPKKTSLA
ncbi:unnamed protein product [Ectocarpus sp. CCAP 1310/34]|nr:unnamed protein product [Ectocarpus sp. CCAP 1310/34]